MIFDKKDSYPKAALVALCWLFHFKPIVSPTIKNEAVTRLCDRLKRKIKKLSLLSVIILQHSILRIKTAAIYGSVEKIIRKYL